MIRIGLKGPLKRVGDRGAGKWQDISWDEAIDIVVNRLKEIRAKNAAHTLAIMDGDSSDLTKMLLERFLRQFGSPNYINVPYRIGLWQCGCLLSDAGHKDGVVYDMEMANYIISLSSQTSCNILVAGSGHECIRLHEKRKGAPEARSCRWNPAIPLRQQRRMNGYR